jgi:formylglycine-generating enzyme required for sulfatase activity
MSLARGFAIIAYVLILNIAGCDDTVSVECREDRDCAESLTCHDGECLPGTPCQGDRDCSAGQTCIDGFCQEDAAVVGPEGGVVEIGEGVVLEIPPGALTEDVEFTATITSPTSEWGAFAEDVVAYEINPSVILQNPVEVSLPVPMGTLAWSLSDELVTSLERHTITEASDTETRFLTDHFSWFVVETDDLIFPRNHPGGQRYRLEVSADDDDIYVLARLESEVLSVAGVPLPVASWLSGATHLVGAIENCPLETLLGREGCLDVVWTVEILERDLFTFSSVASTRLIGRVASYPDRDPSGRVRVQLLEEQRGEPLFESGLIRLEDALDVFGGEYFVARFPREAVRDSEGFFADFVVRFRVDVAFTGGDPWIVRLGWETDEFSSFDDLPSHYESSSPLEDRFELTSRLESRDGDVFILPEGLDLLGDCTPDCGSRECGLDPVCGTLECGWCSDSENCDESSGFCEPSCHDECEVEGGRVCELVNEFRLCGDFDDDSCFELGAAETCDEDQICNMADDSPINCICSDECTEMFAIRCVSSNEYQICADNNHNGCPDWGASPGGVGATVSCPSGEVCTGIDVYEPCGTSCTPDCAGRECGPDGCGGSCAPGCSTGETCNPDGSCVGGGVPGTWVTVTAGTFMMGSPPGELGRDTGETQHDVTLTGDFEILSTEVTQGEFDLLMGYNPSYFSGCGGDCPVEAVSWYEAAAYCNELSGGAGLSQCYDCTGSGASVTCSPAAAYASPYDCPGYRLPTEAEWEYAARAGTTTATYNGDLDVTDCSSSTVLDPIAWYCGNSGGETHEVGTLDANAWGLYDMLGNVWEWCHDWYDDYPSGSVTDPWGSGAGSYRVIRGGSWYSDAGGTRAAGRNGVTPGVRNSDIGFRPVRSSP